MSDPDKIVAVGLLTARDLLVLGQGFSRAYPISETHDFGELLRAIDLAEQVSRKGAAPGA